MEMMIRLDIDSMKGHQVAETFEKLAHEFRTAADDPQVGDSGRVYDPEDNPIGVWTIWNLPN